MLEQKNKSSEHLNQDIQLSNDYQELPACNSLGADSHDVLLGAAEITRRFFEERNKIIAAQEIANQRSSSRLKNNQQKFAALMKYDNSK